MPEALAGIPAAQHHFCVFLEELSDVRGDVLAGIVTRRCKYRNLQRIELHPVNLIKPAHELFCSL